jgi:hypothetical protein
MSFRINKIHAKSYDLILMIYWVIGRLFDVYYDLRKKLRQN